MPRPVTHVVRTRLQRAGGLALLLATLPAVATTSQPPAPATTPYRLPREWAAIASEQEVRAITRQGPSLRYTMRTVDQKGERIRNIVECDGGTVARLLSKDGKPLTADEDAAERQRLLDLAASPEDFSRHSKGDATEKKLAIDLIRMMPDAMIYTPVSPNTATLPNAPHALVFDFAPNPSWSPPTTTSEALTGLRGRIWIDPQSGAVLRMQGEVFRPVNFGWGMVAHVYPGGQLLLEQRNATDDRWIFSHFEEHIKVRALLLKTVDINSTIDSTNYSRVAAGLSWKQAIELLLH